MSLVRSMVLASHSHACMCTQTGRRQPSMDTLACPRALANTCSAIQLVRDCSCCAPSTEPIAGIRNTITAYPTPHPCLRPACDGEQVITALGDALGRFLVSVCGCDRMAVSICACGEHLRAQIPPQLPARVHRRRAFAITEHMHAHARMYAHTLARANLQTGTRRARRLQEEITNPNRNPSTNCG